MGSTEFGLRCLERLASLPDCTVVGIVTNPRTFSISYSETAVTNIRHADISSFGEEHGIDTYIMQESMHEPELLNRIQRWGADFILVAGWYHMVPRKIRDIAPTLGLHASLLPDYSGGAPLVWAIINGETTTGITLFQMDSGVDSGPVLGRKREPIYSYDTISTLYARVENRGLELIEECLGPWHTGQLVPEIQDESARRIFPQRSPQDGRIDWSWSAKRIHDFVRAQTRPYPGAFCFLGGMKLTVWSAMPAQCGVAEDVPGQMTIAEDESGKRRLLVHAGDGCEAVFLDEVQLEAEESMPGLSFFDRNSSIDDSRLR
ncbi:MAG: methionyl-tRNA formyltransferase [Desulfatibacillaceae bacterium]